LLYFGSDVDLSLFLGNLTPALKQKMLHSMTSGQFTDFVARDIGFIKALCDDLEPSAYDKAPQLQVHYEPVQGSNYGAKTHSYDYLFKDIEKFQYIQSHANPQYLKRFWNGTQRQSSPLCELCSLIETNQESPFFATLFDQGYNTVSNDKTPKLDYTLWVHALELSSSEQNGTIAPLLFLSKRLPIDSFFSTIQEEISDFFDWCSNEQNHHIIEFFYRQLLQLDSDTQITQILTERLKDRSGKTVLDVLDAMDFKPAVYEQLKVMAIKANLIQHMEHLFQDPNDEDLELHLKNYSEEYLKRPYDLIPISQLRMDNSNSSSPLIVDIIKGKGRDSVKEVVNKILEQEKAIAPIPKGYEACFFKSALADRAGNLEKKQGFNL
jgi:hypothetical protein